MTMRFQDPVATAFFYLVVQFFLIASEVTCSIDLTVSVCHLFSVESFKLAHLHGMIVFSFFKGSWVERYSPIATRKLYRVSHVKSDNYF